MQQNLTKQQNFKLKLLEIKKVEGPTLVLRGSYQDSEPELQLYRDNIPIYFKLSL